ncbi:MAG: adenylate/guanylate cyclase domain-containing protein [Methylacidiphilales bacterium]|nr:adenylate/guanylate cyclase domain-containing protein [Candidatus Methylacidiphilales bacterium]
MIHGNKSAVNAAGKIARGHASAEHILPFSFSLLACGLAMVFFFSDAGQGLEGKAVDYFQLFRYKLTGPVCAPDLAFIGIDDKSVDPSYSAFSSLWGRDSWVTREAYTFQLQTHAGIYHPKVLAYDIIFRPGGKVMESSISSRLENKEQSAAALSKARKLYEEAESEGNDSLLNLLFTFDDLSQQGKPAPRPLFAYYFPDDAALSARLAGDSGKQESVFKRYLASAIPEGLVEGGVESPMQAAIPLIDQLMAESTPAWFGPINVQRDAGGVVRRVPLLYAVQDPQTRHIRHVPSFALNALMAYWDINPAQLKKMGGGTPAFHAVAGDSIVIQTKDWTRRIPVDEQFRLFLNTECGYRDRVLPSLSYVDVTECGLALDADLGYLIRDPAQRREKIALGRDTILPRLQGKIAVIGQAFTASGDIGSFALEDNVPNALAHLYAMDNILRGDYLRYWTPRQAVILLALLAAATCLLHVFFRKFTAVAVGMGLLCVVYPAAAAASALWLGRLEPFLTPSLMLLALFAANSIFHYILESRRRGVLRKAFSAAVSPRVLELLEANPERFSLQGEKAETSVFFSDIAGFTTIAEKLAPQELSALLNRYLTPMSDIILASDGYIDKYQGDAIMAVWGVPLPEKEHAAKACGAALDQLERLKSLEREIENDTGIRIDVRMGINSGIVSAGNMGSAKKQQYTVMGDAVNLAARLEPINKDYGTHIIIGENTRKLLPEGGWVTRLLDKVVVKGKTEPVLIYELVGRGPGRPDWIKFYEQGLQRLWEKKWAEAGAAFGECRKVRPQDPAVRLMLERVDQYKVSPPPEGWNGAFARQSKD